MIIFLYGPDDYRREEKKREIIAEFEKKHSGIGHRHFDLLEEDGEEAFREFIKNQSIFESAKLAVLEGLFEKGSKAFAGELKDLAKQKAITILISEKGKPPKDFSFLTPGAKTKKNEDIMSQCFDDLEGTELRKFIKIEAMERGAGLTEEAVKFLADAYRKDTWRLMTELEKLSLMVGKTIDKKDLEKMDIDLPLEDFWGTIRGLKSYKIGERLSTLERLFFLSEPAAKIFNLLVYQWPEKLQTFAAYDLAVKSGKCDYEEVLLDAVLG